MRLREVALLHHKMRQTYGNDYLRHCMEWGRYNRTHRIFWADENVALRKKVDMMLEFKNSKGEVVMSEKDNGSLEIHDEALKESMEKGITLEEVRKSMEKEEK